jgi:hypothetical protein
MEQQDPCHSFNSLPLVSPSLSEASKLTVPLPHPSTGQEDPLRLTWSSPPNQTLTDTLHGLRNEFLEFKNEARRQISTLQEKANESCRKLSTLEEKVLQIDSQVVLFADTIHLRCMLDVWIHANGFEAASGSRTSWLNQNKKRLSNISGIPERDLEDFLE